MQTVTIYRIIDLTYGKTDPVHHLFVQYGYSRQSGHDTRFRTLSFQWGPPFQILRFGTDPGQFASHRNLGFGFLGQGHPDRIPDSFIQQGSDPHCRTDTSVFTLTGFRNSQMQRITHSLSLHFLHQ